MTAREPIVGQAPPWRASLALEFASSPLGTRLVSRRHEGPLVVQRPLYPEGPCVCHAIVVHPPGGIAGGDVLELDVRTQRNARALLTTPGAAKIYRSAGREARQHVRLRADAAASLEWLPQETIVFDAADACLVLDLEVEATACAIAWDVVALGREAMGEAFARGRLRSHLRVRHGDELTLDDTADVRGGSAWLDSPVGWRSARACGAFVAVGAAIDDAVLESARAALLPWQAAAAISRPAPGLLVGRYLGPTAVQARTAFTALWACIRPALVGIPATPPRIWAT